MFFKKSSAGQIWLVGPTLETPALSKSKLVMKRLSLDDEGVLVKLYDDTTKSVLPHLQLIENDLYPGKYVACIYDQDWYIGVITKCSNENKDVYIKFIKQNNLVLTWPQSLKNECWIPLNDVIFTSNPPELQ